ncbi:MAG: polysulfide reductase NrfD [Myxococcales bacterium]|nr:polysulfide reductase NrfD [Myxococcales bacterium]
MANYGFVIDNTSCIGCHACSTACKSENEVPLGVNRTWVKYTEVGTYPDVKRHFQVTRCNHCSNPPCVRICPTGAMYQRDDGIVEFNKDACIGCKACMQACPYDAIYIDPETSTAAKCHYCSHRVEVGLEPSCAVVCPTHAIIAGDLDDPASEISRVLAKSKVTVRKPEQGTAPKVFYVEGHEVTLTPTATERAPETFMWADVIPLHAGGGSGHAPARPRRSLPVLNNREGVRLRAPQPQGEPVGGPLKVGERRASHMVQVGYNAQHKIPWHWPVPAYLVTKGVGAGVFLFLTLAFALGLAPFQATVATIGAALSVAFMGLTTALLVYDLERPWRFLFILLRPQWRSWLARGAVALIGFSTLGGLWLAAEGAALVGWLDPAVAALARPWLTWIGAPFAIGAAVYTAFLFGQAEGRDLWQSSLLPVHLLVQALMMGAAAVLAIGAFATLSPELSSLAVKTLAVAIGVDLFMLVGELGMPHASEVAARASHEITRGRYATVFWWGAVAVGHVIPFALLFVGAPLAAAAAGLLTAVGLYAYEHAFVMTPQEVPNS